MEYESGDEYDCVVCGDTHVVERGRGLRVVGSSERLDPRTYVRCPEAGVIPLDGAGSGPASAPEPERTADGTSEDDWP